MQVFVTLMYQNMEKKSQKISFLKENIKTIRKSWGMTQTDFGKLFGLSRGAINQYEYGRSEPTIENMILLQMLTNVNVYELYFVELEMKMLQNVPLLQNEIPPEPLKLIEEPDAIYNKDVEDKLALFAKELAKLQDQVEELEGEMDRK